MPACAVLLCLYAHPVIFNYCLANYPLGCPVPLGSFPLCAFVHICSPCYFRYFRAEYPVLFCSLEDFPFVCSPAYAPVSGRNMATGLCCVLSLLSSCLLYGTYGLVFICLHWFTAVPSGLRTTLNLSLDIGDDVVRIS